ncbi:stearoyl-CoA desaturase 5-like [Cloeon dipterum]|uniref:stearoyl-CoA desaturase 5-like n=1 Tax=Cloeon dipterum TaxID=197152 RepID=UPI0032207D6E
MAPGNSTVVVTDEDLKNDYQWDADTVPEKSDYLKKLKLTQTIGTALFHLLAAYGLLFRLFEPQWKTFAWFWIIAHLTGIATGCGMHRYWTHRSFKATLPLRFFFTFFYAMAGQVPIKHWVRDHRTHHKFSETDADPYDSRRGYFFSHIGWYLTTKHPLVIEKGSQIDISDLKKDPLIVFHDKYFQLNRLILCYTLPTLVPTYFWGESLWISFLANCVRYCYVLNAMWSINSLAHFQGHRPYDKTMRPRNNLFVSLVTLGEGWHNFHHSFPWDYRSTEDRSLFNPNKHFVDLMAKLGWAYDLKISTDDVIRKKIKRTGDGSHQWGTVGGVPIFGSSEHEPY